MTRNEVPKKTPNKDIKYLVRLPQSLAIQMQEELHALRIEEIQSGGRGKASIASFWREAAAAYVGILRANRLAS